jgi:trimeric autotransporter adhesin
MAQDFKAAFGVGESDTGITSIDADGVALAAIQGLNQKLEQKQTEITELRQEVAELKVLVRQINARINGGAR